MAAAFHRRARPARRAARTERARTAALLLALLVVAVVGVGGLAAVGVRDVGAPARGGPEAFGSSGGSSDGYGYCASSGPEWLGIDWNCVAVLNLTEVLLILGGIGILLYVFWDSDAAELPGDDLDVPLTEAEWQQNRDRRAARLDPGRAESDRDGGPR